MSSNSSITKADPAILLQQLRAVVDSPEEFAADRQEIVRLARKATVMLEDPFEMFQRLAYSALPLVTVRVAQDHKIFQTLVENKDGPTSAAVLAEKTGINPTVLDSLLEYMTTQHMIEESSPQNYVPTKLSNILLAPLFVDGVVHFHDNCLPAFNALNYSLSNPTDPRTAFEVGQNSPTDFYTWLETHPVQGAAFHRFMEAQFASLPTWLDVVPFGTEYAQLTDPETPVFVDVGGGNGQQCVALQKKYPTLIGKVILQDRPAVLEKAITGQEVERMSYDYLTPQPIKGARAYYFRQIFHNNNDAVCLQILQAHIPSLSPSSVILIDDKVLPDEKPEGGAVEYTAGLSLAMLVMFKALERRESQWRKLLGDAGLEIKAIRRFTDFGDSIIVAGLK
ncbi:hypothetical protein G7Y89_g412 [Cudoniella acicularis]|uniref:O-methyltransferase domain-containing protein n=1 Tax=Cudoniella acicularis TaxID=354080 RepID=A0A8H4WB72_9HELO|nr:hypothetical protein G7Y89_g412 [Cudoniella acicularis]